MVKDKSIKKTAVSVPKSVEGLADFLRQVGETQRKLIRIQAVCNERIERIKKQAMEDSIPLEAAKDELFEGVFIYCQAHRDELTQEGKTKTVVLPTGDVYWRLTPPAVLIKNAAKVMESCESMGLSHFIRIKKEIDKAAMLKQQERAKLIPGVKIEQKEEFGVKPSETQIEISKDSKKLQKILSGK